MRASNDLLKEFLTSAMLSYVLNPQQVLGERLKLNDRESWDSKEVSLL
jgi:hypothetical protein